MCLEWIHQSRRYQKIYVNWGTYGPVFDLLFVLGSWSSDAEPLQDDPALEEGYCHAILCRLRFRKV